MSFHLWEDKTCAFDCHSDNLSLTHDEIAPEFVIDSSRRTEPQKKKKMGEGLRLSISCILEDDDTRRPDSDSSPSSRFFFQGRNTPPQGLLNGTTN